VNGNTMSTASSHAFTQARKRQCTMSAELQGTCRRSALQKHLIFFGMTGGRAWRSHKNANHRSLFLHRCQNVTIEMPAPRPPCHAARLRDTREEIPAGHPLRKCRCMKLSSTKTSAVRAHRLSAISAKSREKYGASAEATPRPQWPRSCYQGFR
jgi:hypothetical protein